MTPEGSTAGSGADEALTVAPLTIGPDEIARFITKVYDQHPHGSSFVPRWTGPLLKHIIFDDPDFTPDHAIGAYLGDRLVGLIMAQPYAVHLDDRRLTGIYGSWLAVTPEAAGQFAAIKLIHELTSRLAARGAEFMVGVAYRSGPGVGLEFWESYARAFPKKISPGRDLKYWARVLDGAAFASAIKDPLLKLGAHAARLRPVSSPRNTSGIRDFAEADLARCQDLLAKAPARLRSAPSLWQLQGASSLDDGPQTLVLDRGAGPEALSMFHLLPMEDAAPLRVGIIEHLVGVNGTRDRQHLLAATLWRLKESAACLALLPQKPHIGSSEMVLAGFIPYDAHFKIYLMPLNDTVPPEMPAGYDLLVR